MVPNTHTSKPKAVPYSRTAQREASRVEKKGAAPASTAKAPATSKAPAASKPTAAPAAPAPAAAAASPAPHVDDMHLMTSSMEARALDASALVAASDEPAVARADDAGEADAGGWPEQPSTVEEGAPSANEDPVVPEAEAGVDEEPGGGEEDQAVEEPEPAEAGADEGEQPEYNCLQL